MRSKMKLFICLTLISIFILTGNSISLAEVFAKEQALQRIDKAIVLYLDSPIAYVNGKSVMVDGSNQEISPIVKNGRTLVPVRIISESLGAKVEWNKLTQEVVVRLDNNTVTMKVGSKNIKVNSKNETIDVPAEIITGRTYLPVRSLAESLGKKVFYNSGLIVISDQETIINPETEQELIDECIFLCTGRGNSISNLISRGHFAQYGEWLIYQNAEVQRKLYKSKTNGTQRVKLSDDVPLYINVIGNWIYYLDEESERLYKIRVDGTEVTEVEADNCMPDFIHLVGDWIYYRDNDEKSRLYKIRTDGSEKTKLSDDDTWNISIIGDWIYYQANWGNFVEPNFKIRFDGTQKTRIY